MQSEHYFFSFTETPDEVSLILDETLKKSIPSTTSDFKESNAWRAIQVSVGGSPSQAEGVVSAIAEPLGRAGISIFYYATFNADYILVEENTFSLAKRVIQKNFSTSADWSDEEGTQQISDGKEKKLEKSFTTSPSNTDLSKFRQLQSFPNLSLFLTSMHVSSIDYTLRDLIKLLFYPER